MNYSEKLKDPRWQKKRLQVFERDGWKCQTCDDTETTLHVHHSQYSKGNPWGEPMENLMTLCEHCHTIHEVHKGEEEKILLVTKHKLTENEDCFLVYCRKSFTVYRGVYPGILGVVIIGKQFDRLMTNLNKYCNGEEKND